MKKRTVIVTLEMETTMPAAHFTDLLRWTDDGYGDGRSLYAYCLSAWPKQVSVQVVDATKPRAKRKARKRSHK